MEKGGDRRRDVRIRDRNAGMRGRCEEGERCAGKEMKRNKIKYV